jgi:hypothetical protein
LLNSFSNFLAMTDTVHKDGYEYRFGRHDRYKRRLGRRGVFVTIKKHFLQKKCCQSKKKSLPLHGCYKESV